MHHQIHSVKLREHSAIAVDCQPPQSSIHFSPGANILLTHAEDISQFTLRTPLLYKYHSVHTSLSHTRTHAFAQSLAYTRTQSRRRLPKYIPAGRSFKMPKFNRNGEERNGEQKYVHTHARAQPKRTRKLNVENDDSEAEDASTAQEKHTHTHTETQASSRETLALAIVGCRMLGTRSKFGTHAMHTLTLTPSKIMNT